MDNSLLKNTNWPNAQQQDTINYVGRKSIQEDLWTIGLKRDSTAKCITGGSR